MAGLKVKIGADASQFERTMRGVRRDVGGVKKAILGIGAATGAILAVNKAFDGMRAAARGAFEFIKESSKEAAGIESLTMQFETLLGGAGEAKKRMEEVTKFAASTPFEIKELAATSKLLQTLGGSLLATGDGLRIVGDAAAIAGQPIQEVGLHIGRLFNAITSGTSAGESVNRLQELGLIGGDVKREFEELAKAQKKGEKDVLSQADAMKLLQSILVKTEGAMAKLATTTEGKLSNMQDNVDQLQATFGKGFNKGLKEALDATNEFLPKLSGAFEKAGITLGTAIKEAVNGDPAIFIEIGALIADLVKTGFKTGMRRTGEGIASSMLRGLSNMSFGVGGKQLKELMQRQADIIDEGANAGVRGDVSLALARAKERLGGINQMVQSANSGPSAFNQAQDMMRGMMKTMQALPAAEPNNPFNRDRELAILAMIEKHLRGGVTN